MALPWMLQEAAFAAEDFRPTLSGPEATAEREGFAVHWTGDGADAIPLDDADGDGTPDAAERVLDALVAAEDFYAAEGWRRAVRDDGAGGSLALDVYLRDVDINGYAHPVDLGLGEPRACWMEVDHALAGDNLVLESVAAHELHHCVEYAYTANSDGFLYEMTATWAQYRAVVDDVLEIGGSVLWQARLGAPERRFDGVGSRFEYAGFVWPKFWTEFQGRDPARAPELWEALGAEGGDWEAAHDAEAERLWGLSFEEAFLEHAVWNGFACGRDDGAHYEPLVHRCLIDASVPVREVVDGAIVFAHVDDPFTARYATAPAGGDTDAYALSCDALPEDTRAGVALVALDANGIGGEAITGWAGEGEGLELALTEPVDPAGGVLIVHASTGRDPATQTCALARVAPEPTEQPRGCATGPGGAMAVLGALLALRVRRA